MIPFSTDRRSLMMVQRLHLVSLIIINATLVFIENQTHRLVSPVQEIQFFLASNVTDQRVGINTGTIEPVSTLEVGGDITLTYNTGSFVIGQVTDHYAITISNTDLFGIGGDSYVYVNKDGGLANKDKDFGTLGDCI